MATDLRASASLVLAALAAEGESVITLETLGAALIPRGIESEELVEALEWLLEQCTIIEVGENEFVLG